MLSLKTVSWAADAPLENIKKPTTTTPRQEAKRPTRDTRTIVRLLEATAGKEGGNNRRDTASYGQGEDRFRSDDNPRPAGDSRIIAFPEAGKKGGDVLHFRKM
jgi:hypothetical protein